MLQPFRLLSAVSEHSLALVTQGQVNRSRHVLANRRVGIDLVANGFVSGRRHQTHNFAILPQESEQEMLSFNVRRSVLARFVPRIEDDAAGFLGVSLKHGVTPKRLFCGFSTSSRDRTVCQSAR